MTLTGHLQPVLDKRLPAALVAVALSLGVTDCGNGHPVQAKYCATVAAFHASDRRAEKQLVTLIEKFAAAHHLELVDGQQVDTNEYRGKATLLDLTFGMGDFGSVVTLFYEGSAGDYVKTELNTYLAQQVNPIFKVRQCSDIPGFAPPALSNEYK